MNNNVKQRLIDIAWTAIKVAVITAVIVAVTRAYPPRLDIGHYQKWFSVHDWSR